MTFELGIIDTTIISDHSHLGGEEDPLVSYVRIIYLGEPLISKPEPAACPSETLTLLTLVIPQRSENPCCVNIIRREKNHLIFLVIGILTQLTTVFSFSLFLVQEAAAAKNILTTE